MDIIGYGRTWWDMVGYGGISAGPSLRGTTAADIGNQVLMTSHSFQDFNCLLAVVNYFQDFNCVLAVFCSQVADCCLLSVIVG